jgi:hypothetical protein
VAKFTNGVVDTGGKFATDVVDMKIRSKKIKVNIKIIRQKKN